MQTPSELVDAMYADRFTEMEDDTFARYLAEKIAARDLEFELRLVEAETFVSVPGGSVPAHIAYAVERDLREAAEAELAAIRAERSPESVADEVTIMRDLPGGITHVGVKLLDEKSARATDLEHVGRAFVYVTADDRIAGLSIYLPSRIGDSEEGLDEAVARAAGRAG